MRRSFTTAVPVSAPPHPPQVRAAISELIADYAPTELQNITVDRRTDDWVTITADLPTGIGRKVTREVYLDEVTV